MLLFKKQRILQEFYLFNEMGLWHVCGRSVAGLWQVCGRSVAGLWLCTQKYGGSIMFIEQIQIILLFLKSSLYSMVLLVLPTDMYV